MIEKPITRLENANESLTSRMNHTGDIISRLKEKVDNLYETSQNKKIK